MTHFRLIVLTTGLAAITALSLPVSAQTLPQQVNPGTLNTPQTLSPYQTDTGNTTGGSRDQSQPGLNVPSQPSIVQVDGDTFQVNHIEVSGNSIISDDAMRQITAPYEGRRLSAEDLANVVAKINEQYRLKGYLTSLAFVPPQDLERGTITVKVLEGMIGDMEIEGNKYFKAKVIERRIAAKPGEPLNIPALEKDLLRINRQEPFKLKATLSPGDKTGETKVHFDVLEQQPFQVALNSDNMGRPYIGTYRGGVEVTDRNVSGRGDRFTARWSGTTGTQIASSSYTLPLGSHGTEISGLFGFSHVNVDLDVEEQPRITGNGFNYGLLLSQPLDRERTFVADLGLNARQVTSFYDGEEASKDAIRSATLGLNFNKYDRYGRTFARVAGTLAPDWLGANTSFIKGESFVTRVTRLPKNNLLILRAYSQWTPDDLPAPEQFQLGGYNTVRGYTEGLLLGDRGFNVSAEWRYPIPGLKQINPWLGERVQGVAFVDYGRTWMDKGNKFYVSNVSNRSERQQLLSAGVGLRAHLTDYLQGYADVAFGLLDRDAVEPKGQPVARLHFGVRSELLPNDYKKRNDVVTPIKTDVFRTQSSAALNPGEVQTDIADPTLEPIDATFRSRKVY